MMQTFKILNLESLKKASYHKTPFPYIIIDNIIQPNVLGQVVDSFPKLSQRGSYPLSAVSASGSFATLLEELQKPELRDIIGQRFGMDLSDKPPMVTVRGYTTERDGLIHVDSSSKLITFLLYFNPNWQNPGGRLRLLHNGKDMDNYFAEVTPEAGRCLIFKVTPNCWHGHEPFIGERRSIQLNYVTSDSAKDRHLWRHKFSAFLKKLFRVKDEKNPIY
jgi:hypothetical protein